MEISAISDYHIHIYYDAETIQRAKQLGQEASKLFSLPLGHFHERNVGPHPMWSVQLTVPTNRFQEAVSWFCLNRSGLTIFTHPNTGNDLLDHRDHAIWMGQCLPLNLEMFV